jgi:hypothetical protein
MTSTRYVVTYWDNKKMTVKEMGFLRPQDAHDWMETLRRFPARYQSISYSVREDGPIRP